LWFHLSQYFISPPPSILSKDGVDETHATLIELWDEVSNNFGPRAIDVFQDISQKQIICNMSSDASPTPFSNRLQPVVISQRLSNLQMARENCRPAPALDVDQMNQFNDLQTLDLLGDELFELQVKQVNNLSTRISIDMD
jgi:hypothetical protein